MFPQTLSNSSPTTKKMKFSNVQKKTCSWAGFRFYSDSTQNRTCILYTAKASQAFGHLFGCTRGAQHSVVLLQRAFPPRFTISISGNQDWQTAALSELPGRTTGRCYERRLSLLSSYGQCGHKSRAFSASQAFHASRQDLHIIQRDLFGKQSRN